MSPWSFLVWIHYTCIVLKVTWIWTHMCFCCLTYLSNPYGIHYLQWYIVLLFFNYVYKGKGWPEGGTIIHYMGTKPSNAHVQAWDVRDLAGPMGTLLESVPLGKTDLTAAQVRQAAQRLGDEKYNERTYHLLQNNCVHFCEDFAPLTTGKQVGRVLLEWLKKKFLLEPSNYG